MVYYKTIRAKINFIPNNFRFVKNMQGDSMHDDARRQDDAKKKRTNNSNIGEFSGSL
jgi:hypothetical protein